jgi:hypothetical protein
VNEGSKRGEIYSSIYMVYRQLPRVLCSCIGVSVSGVGVFMNRSLILIALECIAYM